MSDLRATVDDVMRWGPCGPYNRERVEALWAGRESLSALEIADLDIPAEVRLWAVLREELVPAPLLHEFACRCAERALQREREAGREPDPRSWAAVAAKRDWLAGEIGDAALRDAEDAARNAAWEAARTAAWNAARAAARAAAWAAEAAAWAAAWAAEAAAGEDAAWAAARAAAWAAEAAAWAAAWAAEAAAGEDAAWAAARAARDVERADQLEILRQMLKRETKQGGGGTMITDLLEATTDMDPTERLDLITELRDRLHNDAPLVVRQLDAAIADLRESLFLCRSCGSAMRTRVWHEHHPYGSTTAREELSEMYCPCCEESPQ